MVERKDDFFGNLFCEEQKELNGFGNSSITRTFAWVKYEARRTLTAPSSFQTTVTTPRLCRNCAVPQRSRSSCTRRGATLSTSPLRCKNATADRNCATAEESRGQKWDWYWYWACRCFLALRNCEFLIISCTCVPKYEQKILQPFGTFVWHLEIQGLKHLRGENFCLGTSSSIYHEWRRLKTTCGCVHAYPECIFI